MSKNSKILTLSLLSIFLLITSFLTVRIVTTPRPEEIRTRSRAEVAGFNDVLIEFDMPSTLYVGQEYEIPLTINTQGTEVAAVQLQITFNENGSYITPISESLDAVLTTQFNYSVNRIITDSVTGVGTIQIAALLNEHKNPYSSTSPEEFAILHCRVEAAGRTGLIFDPDLSIATPHGSGHNVLSYTDAVLNLAVDNNPPAAFNLSSPANDAQVGVLKPTFSWQASNDAETGLAKYQLFLDGALAVDNIPSEQTSQQAPNSLADGTSHVWYVKAIDQVGNQRQSTNTWTFTINTQSSLSFQVKFQGIDIQSSGSTKAVRVTLRPTGGGPEDVRENIELTANISGVYQGIVDNIPPNTYTILIKGPAHLQKNFGEIEFIAGQTIEKDWTADDLVLLAGDITGVDETPPDNIVNAADYGIFAGLYDPFNLYQNLYEPGTREYNYAVLADFNADGYVNAPDYGLLAGNFDPFGGGDE